MSSTSSSTSSTVSSTATSSSSSSSTATLSVGGNLKIVGIILAICSGLLIGSSFVLKKKGLLRSQAGAVAGEGVAYLKSPLWWTGMTMMILGEICNFAAYAFVEAIVVTPLGALSVVVCAILSSFFLKETLTFFGWLGCSLCILGSVIIALNGPQEPSVGDMNVFRSMFLAPGFLTWGIALIAASLFIIFYVGPRWGKQQMIWYILVCSMIGGISVSVTTGLGAAFVLSAFGHSQFHNWFLYFLMAFVAITLITEVYYLNVALALFNTAMVTPTYYVIFTFFTMITTIVLFKGLQSSASQIMTLVMGFLVICVGITILQLSKIDPKDLSTKLDRRSTILLQAVRSQTQSMEEKSLTAIEDPGIDALRGSFGTFGSIIRARSAHRMSLSSRNSKIRVKSTGAYDPTGLSWASDQAQAGSELQGLPLTDPLSGLKRHQLYDNPVPKDDTSSTRSLAVNSTSPRPNDSRFKRPTIKFDSQDVVHQYDRPGTGDNRATHEHRAAYSSPGPRSSTFVNPPDSPSSQRTSTVTQQEEEPQIPKLPPPIGLPTEGVLLQLDSPEQIYDFREEAKQLWLNTSSKEQQSPQPRSAPSTFSPRFQQAQAQAIAGLPHRKDSRDVFVDSPGGNTLKSFPSITESGRSETVWDDEELERQKQKAKERDRARSVAKRYPKTRSVDDAEESQRLFQRQSVGNLPAAVRTSEEGTEESEDTATAIGSPGGIRLVKPRKGPEL